MPLRFAYENIEYGGEIVNRIKKLHPEYFVLDQNMGGDYNSMVKNIRMILKIFFIIVITISGFTEYMRKYRKDMAVIRTVGEKQRQVQTIFSSMSAIISGCECLAGALFSALVSGVTLKWFNDKVQLFDGSVNFNWKVLCQITIIVFVLFNLFVYVVFYFGQTVLPVQVFQKISSGLKKKSQSLSGTAKDFWKVGLSLMLNSTVKKMG